MIVVEIAGGLGNQMHQYGAGRAVAARLGVPLGLDIRHYGEARGHGLDQFPRAFKLGQFNIDAAVLDPAASLAIRDRYRKNIVSKAICGQIRRRLPQFPCGHFLERTMNYDPIIDRLPDNTYLQGYFQSEHYLKPVEAAIRRELTPRDAGLTAYAQQYVAERRRPGRPVVSVHVRRGDLAFGTEVARNIAITHGPPVTTAFLRAAMAAFGPEATFLVFSDSSRDLDWCREQLSADDVHFCYGHNDLQDFAAMRACDHHVVSNSSFSWWAAWLNEAPGKRVIAPDVWFHPGRFPDHRLDSILPAGWEVLPTAP